MTVSVIIERFIEDFTPVMVFSDKALAETLAAYLTETTDKYHEYFVRDIPLNPPANKVRTYIDEEAPVASSSK